MRSECAAAVVGAVALAVQMLSKSQTWTLDSGQTAQLACEFIADTFNLFDNPVIWRKRQVLRPTAAAAATTPLRERLQAATLGNHMSHVIISLQSYLLSYMYLLLLVFHHPLTLSL